MTHEIIIAGFGGQGVMLMGQFLTYAGMMENRQVSWIPSYGPEMRGGTANCSVIISDRPVGAPIVTEPTAVVAMNQPSLEKFEQLLRPDGTIIINSSLIMQATARGDVRSYLIPANEVAERLGHKKTANMVALGAVIAATGAVTSKSVIDAFARMFAAKPDLARINEQALLSGISIANNYRKHW